jgi:hypothetical protein
MIFTTTEDIEAPIAHVFTSIADFPGFERQILRRGAEVRRIDGDGAVQLGTAWDVSFQFRGKMRRLRATVSAFDQPNGYTVTTGSDNLIGTTVVDLMALSRDRTRISVTIEVVPKTLKARLLIQSLKLGKASLTKRFKTRIAEHASDLEARFGKSERP